MNGFFNCEVLGRVLNVTPGVSKAGKAWCRVSLVVKEYTGGRGADAYAARFVNVAVFERAAEAIQKAVSKGSMLWATGQVKLGKPFKDNQGKEHLPFDLMARDWAPAGVVPERDSSGGADSGADEGADDGNPFA